MKKTTLIFVFLVIQATYLLAQKNSITIKPAAGIGYADTTFFSSVNLSLGFQFTKNRFELNIQSGSKKRKNYANGDYQDALMINYTITYSRFITKNRISIVPFLGTGYVSGRWKTTQTGNTWLDADYSYQTGLLTGFGIHYGLGLEYNVTKWLSVNLKYNEALLLSDLSGNRALFLGPVFKISKKSKED